MSLLDVKSAKQNVIQLLGGLTFGQWSPAGFGMTVAAAKAFRTLAMSNLVQPVGNRLSPSGNRFDLYASSAWHALSAVMVQQVYSRLKRSSYRTACSDLRHTFGQIPIYRGQARAWDIQPSSWRTPASAASSRSLLSAFASAMREHLEAIPDPVFEAVGRPLEDTSFAGLAQHYEIPTSLVDFTFDPLVAIGFACGRSESNTIRPRDIDDPALANCAVVYVIAMPAFATVASPQFSCPPSYSLRLYRQSGIFADFGPYPGEDQAVIQRYEQQWSWVQQNCQRIFFPRAYPEASDEVEECEITTSCKEMSF